MHLFGCGGSDETGLFYGVNLRGDSFLILCAHLGGKNEPISELQREEVFIPSNLIDSTSKVRKVYQ